ncbi:homoserine kinase [Klenkia marina]|uniref:Homoserine kinase n=1 Tax=Klenkia marina TaxID=1960309 RepID=A0A1G4YGG2_9ACTN|nr:homoserine kinase [Klenkia marina]SCX52429.1 homoserine kinase [Klenkia marina]
MSAADGGAVRIRVPATSANLGPAFDSAGLALARYDELEVSVADGLHVEVEGFGADTLPRDESHLVVRAFRAACVDLGWVPPGLSLRSVNGIPQGRGMGSSAAAVVGGILAAWALCPAVTGIDDERVLALADDIEGHPDNVAACLLGGLTLSWTGPEGVRAVSTQVAPEVSPVLCVPSTTLSTHVARGLLPPTVSHADAVFNAGRSALLVHALTAAPQLLLDATDDRLHQDQRGPAMPATAALVGDLRDAGHAAVVSGAGPSVLVLVPRPEDRSLVHTVVPDGWEVLDLAVEARGARVRYGDGAVSS